MRPSTRRLLWTASAFALLQGGVTDIALAQSGEQLAQAPRALEEIVVTARKREESLIDLPIAVTAFSAVDIERQQILDMRDIGNLAPGVTFQTTGGAGTGRFVPNVVIRGLQNAVPLPRQQTGAVFVDGIFVLGGVAAVNTIDVERVEVIRGPQSAYFGRNTFGGAINFITKDPGDEFGGEVSAEGTTRESFALQGSIEGPIVPEVLAARLVASYREKGAHYTATDGGDLGEESTAYLAGTLYATPTDNWWIRLRGSYQEDDDGPGTIVALNADRDGDTCISRGATGQGVDLVTGEPRTFNVTLPYFCGSVPTIDDLGEGIVTSNTSLRNPVLDMAGVPNLLVDGFLNNSTNNEQVSRAPDIDGPGLLREIIRVTLQTEYTFDNGISLAANFGYEDTDSIALFDSDRSDTFNTWALAPLFSEVKSYEIRLTSDQDDSFRWLLGYVYQESEFESNFGGGGALGYNRKLLPFSPVSTSVQVNNFANASSNENAEVNAVFGSIDWDITDKLTVTGELRYQEDTSRVGLQSGATPEVSFTDWLPRVIVKYDITPDINVYASYSVGVLPGAINAQYLNLTPFQQSQVEAAFPGVSGQLDSQELQSYEIGTKGRLFDDRLQYALTGYWMEWTKIQATAALTVQTAADDPTPLVLPGITVPGDAEFWGIEFEASALITDNWDVGVALNYQYGEYTTFVQPFLGNLTGGQVAGLPPGAQAVTRFDGNEVDRVPDWKIALNSTYRDQLVGDWEWFLRGEANYTGEAWESQANLAKFSDYWRVNARLGAENEQWRVELFVTNLFDDDNWNFGNRSVFFGNPGSFLIALPAGNFSFPQGLQAQAPDKRDFGLRVRYRF